MASTSMGWSDATKWVANPNEKSKEESLKWQFR